MNAEPGQCRSPWIRALPDGISAEELAQPWAETRTRAVLINTTFETMACWCSNGSAPFRLVLELGRRHHRRHVAQARTVG